MLDLISGYSFIQSKGVAIDIFITTYVILLISLAIQERR